ncbi:MAG: aminotransferase class I/II-fold pyridoxal phosphate-dependent enzyme [Chloroflexi bacterium]|nr:aminotransferase class I/II-fold pyridoxal phosphate-dependent enzyme [Chloroflexota bacterium]
MTRQILHYHGNQGLNLAQGFPDFPAPAALKEAACAAIMADHNQYGITWGIPSFRQAIARKVARYTGIVADPETQLTVCCGATEAMIATMMGVLNPSDEVVIFQPFYENYGPDCILSGARPRFVALREPDWSFDRDELAAAFGPRTRAIVINTPNNPTGKVFSRDELSFIAGLCQRWDSLAITDEIYEHLVYEGEHISVATLPGMAERTVTISGLSKTYSVTGWRLGYAVASPAITSAIRKVHDFLTVGAPAPLQAAACTALAFEDSYYTQLLADYRQRRDFTLRLLAGAGFRCYPPAGAYYIMTDISDFGFESDVAMAHYLVKDIGVATVPGSSFYHDEALGRQKIRFCFAKRMETLQRLQGLLSRMATPAKLRRL